MAHAHPSLLEYLDTSQLVCLNESPEHPLKSIVAHKKKNTTGSYLLSDTEDPQLLLNIHFNQTVKISAIMLQTANVEQGPKTIGLFTNEPALDFSNVEGEEPDGKLIQEMELSKEVVSEGTRIPLRFVQFQSVNSLHIFVKSNQGGEDVRETRIDAIDIFGLPVMGTRDVSGLKRVGDDA